MFERLMMKPQFQTLFQPLTFNNGTTLPNRLVLAPMTHWASNEDGSASEAEIDFVGSRSAGLGMVISAATAVHPTGRAFDGEPNAVCATDVPGLRRVAQSIQAHGAKAVLQLHHGGFRALPHLVPAGGVVAPSPFTLIAPPFISEQVKAADAALQTEARVLADAEIRELVDAFAQAAEYALEAGFDGVEIHGANGYLLQQFYSAASNRRTDEWGGSRERRMAFPLAVARAVTDAVARAGRADFIVGYRFSPEEAPAEGIKMADTLALIDELVKLPLQYLHVSLGDFNEPAENAAEDSSLPPQRIARIHQHLAGRLPLMGVGGLVSGAHIAAAAQSGYAELIAVGRGAIINPDFAVKIAAGNDEALTDSLDAALGAQQQHIPEALWQVLLRMQPWVPIRNFK
ncbi:NADH-dependent flavin oxidoreductase [Uruburuella testudinis]|uniref:NADH-dependent flavin oxidoreductase n=1 Tax=Uruburuella testudinis TaxID=1282863 RepID=A0ABY4DQ16_9NEIS|nr:NADH-dependent flavin oxidoreductase [Uruburuella testudinis]UOO81136.1 NADH-dependent flavin oxidoreductase [Uruburuella testudinis]